MKDVGGEGFAGSSPPFFGRVWAGVDVDVGPERRSPRYHESGLALESVKESSATVIGCGESRKQGPRENVGLYFGGVTQR